ncbi:MAG: hypothetical protein AAFR88_11995 [Pseudomonadota bacterium]
MSRIDDIERFEAALEDLTPDQVLPLFEGGRPQQLTNQEHNTMEELAKGKVHDDVAQALGLSTTRVRQLQRQSKDRMERVTGLRLKDRSQAIHLFVQARVLCQKPVYRNKKLHAANERLEEATSGLPPRALRSMYETESFIRLIADLEAGGLRALRARLGRLFPFVMIALIVLALGAFGAFSLVIALGLDALQR